MLEIKLNNVISNFLPHRKHFNFITKTKPLLLCSEIIIVELCKSQSTFPCQAAEIFNVKAGCGLRCDCFKVLSHCLTLTVARSANVS